MKKRLRKSKQTKILAGVCGGISEYLDWDPTLVRVLFIILGFSYGLAVVLYILLAIIMPD
ncbi:MAG: PspC domain-containing protein [Bacteroidetes bacterium]|jgi:phage shock protein PspC (stress-responsive transcriptional regulator)|nr:PspC domain-containing protein [Bacteroidota bacterium]